MIITSALAEIFPFPGLLTYCCTKKFTCFLADGLFYELKDKVDVMSYCPGYVATKIVGSSGSDGGDIFGAKVTPAGAAKYAFRDIGHTSKTHGSFVHEILYAFGSTYPWAFYNILFKGVIDHAKKTGL